MKYLKKTACAIMLFLCCTLCANGFIVFGSIVTETYLEDFIPDTYEYILFDDGENISRGYLIEGVTEAYMLYDYDHKELIYYCSNSRSPWTLYENNLFSQYGLYYSNLNGYCLVNLEIDGIHDYGDVINIEGEMEIYKTTDIELANEFSKLDCIPLDINFEDYFPTNNVVENVEIPNAFYFKRLNINVPQNIYGTCTAIAFSTLMGYLDTYYDDDLIEEQYIEKEEVYNHYVQNAISSPGAEGYYNYIMNNVAKETEYYSQCSFDEETPWYTQRNNINFHTIAKQIIDVIKDDSSTALNNHFDYQKITNIDYLLELYDEYKTIEEIIELGFPAVIEIGAQADLEGQIYYVNYKVADGEWKQMVDENGNGGGHSFVCYGYLKVKEIDEENNSERILTYYKGHAGQKNDDGTYDYGYCLYNSRYMYNQDPKDDAIGIKGYTFIPKNNYHKCSKNYIYNNGTCSFGICPCDSKLSNEEFFIKYSNVVLQSGIEKYYCKEHGEHLLYSKEHIHNFQESYNENVHNFICNEHGCSYNITENHNIVCKNFEYNHVNECTECGYEHNYIPESYIGIYEQEHTFYCEYCNETVVLTHILKYEYINSNLHRRYCELCGYNEVVPHDAYDNIIYEFAGEDGEVIYYCSCCQEYL